MKTIPKDWRTAMIYDPEIPPGIDGVCYNCLNGLHTGCDNKNCKCKHFGHFVWWFRRQYNNCAEEMVRCELCRTLTNRSGTNRCDRCWELETRIERDLELAKKIIERIEKEKT